MPMKNHLAHSGFLPVRISSKKIRVKSGERSEMKAAIRLKTNVSQKASLEPRRFFFT